MSEGATLYIDGAWSAAEDGATFAVTDPGDGSLIRTAADGGANDTQRAVDAAAGAFPGWSRRTAYERADALMRAHALMLDRAEDLARLMTREQGKPLKAARNEVRYGADFLSWFAGEAPRVYGASIPASRAGQRLSVLRQPVGVVGAITPWNYPISMITRKVGPAVAAGCTLLLKPAAQTPLCAVAMFEIFADAGFPPGVVNLVTSNRASEVGKVMLESMAVRKLTFTGSTRVGKLLAARAAETMKHVSMELGGHAPFLVFPDADPAHAAKGAALVKFLNTGQACICPNRIYVHRSIIDRFEEVLVERVTRLKAGSGLDESVSIGPLIDSGALAKMAEHVGDAVAKGARLVAGGERLTGPGFDGGLFFAPTILRDVTPDMIIYREETFGPIAALIPFDDEDEVVAAANDTEYGLASYVYTNDLDRAVRVSEALRFGIVGINDINPTAAAAPFGGVNQSGLGREGGADGINEYLDVKLIGQVIAS